MHFWRILRPVYLSGLQSDLDGHVDTFIKNIGLHDLSKKCYSKKTYF